MYKMAAQRLLLLLCTLAALCSSSTGSDDNHVWLLGEDSGYYDNYETVYSSCDTTSVVALTKDRLHVDYYTTVEQLRMIRFNFPLPADFVITRMINEEQQDEVFVAVHKGHMSINRFGNYTTFPIAIENASSLFIISNLACITPANGSKILCVNVVKGTQQLCNVDIPPGSHGYSDIRPQTQLAYIVTPDNETVMKFNVCNDCLTLVSKISENRYGAMWFSYDGSRLFLNNGLTLFALSLEGASTFGGEHVGVSRYSSISQLYRQASVLGESDKPKWPIMTLRNDVKNLVYYFTWNDLMSNGTDAIPSPTGYSIVRPISLQYCQEDFAYALVTYKREKDNSLRTGVAYIKSYI